MSNNFLTLFISANGTKILYLNNSGNTFKIEGSESKEQLITLIEKDMEEKVPMETKFFMLSTLDILKNGKQIA